MNKATFPCKAALAFTVGTAVFLQSFADWNITENITLTEDADWTSYGTVNLSDGVVVDLNGYDLRVGGLAGTGRFISSSDKNLIVNGSFEDLIADSTLYREDSQTPSYYWRISDNLQYIWINANLYPEGWIYGKIDAVGSTSVGYANSKDEWSTNLDAQDGLRSIWWWCQDNQSKGGGTLTQEVDVVTADTYRLSFFTAMRPGPTAYKNMRLYVDVDGSPIGYAVCSEAKWNESTFDVDLSAGKHTITFRPDGTGDGSGSNPCGLLDNVSLFRKRKPCLRLGASPEGSYSCRNITVEGCVVALAESQTLNGDCDWSGLGEVNIASGATIDLAGYNLSVSSLTYDTVAVLYDTEFVADGSFEIVSSWDETWKRNTFADNSASAYVSSDWCGNSKDGSRHIALYIKENSSNKPKIWQTVNVPIDGTYCLSFWTKARPNFRAISVEMSVDGDTLRSFTTPASWQETVVDIELTAGEHELAFSAFRNSTDPSDAALGGGIDLVSLRFADAMVTNSNNDVVSELHADSASACTASDRVAFGGNLKLVQDLAEDTAMTVGGDTEFGCDGWTLDLGGHKLSVNLSNGKFLIVGYQKIENGTIAATAPNKHGWIKFGAACDVDARLEVDCAMEIQADIRVRDYVVNYSSTDSAGGCEMAVYGTFKPNTDMFYGCTMLDQSTIDLSGRTSALPAEAAFTGVKPSRLSVSFEEGATVTVHVDGRTDLGTLARTKEDGAYAGYLMKWNTRPDASVKFILDGDAAQKYRLVCTDDGLVLRPPFGFMILFR